MPVPDSLRETVVMSGEYENLCISMEKYANVIRTQPNPYLPYYLRYHADMQFFAVKDTAFIVPGSEYLEEQLVPFYKNIIYTEETGTEYPQDVKCNARLLDKILLCNAKTLDKKILNYCKAIKLEILNVKQGYASCSTLFIRNNTLLTSDMPIYNLAKKRNFTACLVDNKDILLNGFSCGFIGGSSGSLSKDTVFFTGSLSLTKGLEVLYSFLGDLNIKVIELSADRMVDIGGIIPLKNNL